jgi:transglutaminase-like putative cysteine protease
MARDVQFHFDPPARTWKDEHYGQVPVRDTNIFRNGIESFPPGKQITLWFDRYPDRIEQGLLPLFLLAFLALPAASTSATTSETNLSQCFSPLCSY